MKSRLIFQKNRQLEEEKMNCKVEIESSKEIIQPDLNKFFDLDHLKTKSFICTIFYNYNVIYYQPKVLNLIS